MLSPDAFLQYIELNGMRLSNPERIYTELWCGIKEGKERLAPTNACEKLKAFVTGDEVGANKKRSTRKKKGRLTMQKKKYTIKRAGNGVSYLVLVDEVSSNYYILRSWLDPCYSLNITSHEHIVFLTFENFNLHE